MERPLLILRNRYARYSIHFLIDYTLKPSSLISYNIVRQTIRRSYTLLESIVRVYFENSIVESLLFVATKVR